MMFKFSDTVGRLTPFSKGGGGEKKINNLVVALFFSIRNGQLNKKPPKYINN